MSVYSQEYGYFFNSQNSDRKYNAESFETWLKPFFVSGVFTGGLHVTAQDTPDMTVSVSPGYANLDGKPGHWPDTNTLTLATASGVYSRIDTIVLRRDNTNRCITLDVVTGVASLAPQPTAPQRTGDIFELVLAEVLVGIGVTEITQSVITDKRPDTDVCGYVVAAVQTPDFSELYDQFAAQAEAFMGDQAADFLDWFDEMKDQLSEDAAGHLQLEIDDLQDQIGTVPVGKDLQSEIEDTASELGAAEEALAIVINGDTAPASITSGAYLFIKNHSTLPSGGYHATANISSGASITSSNVAADADGIANALNGKLTNKVIAQVTTDGEKTWSQLLNALYALVVPGNDFENTILKIIGATGNVSIYQLSNSKSGNVDQGIYSNIAMTSSDTMINAISVFQSGSTNRRNTNGTLSNRSSEVVGSGAVLQIIKIYG